MQHKLIPLIATMIWAHDGLTQEVPAWKRQMDKSRFELREDLKTETRKERRFAKLANLACRYASEAISTDEWPQAKLEMESLLSLTRDFRHDFNYGNALHHGNLALGRYQLALGNTKDAIDFLKKAGNTPGSPNLNSFGPNMTLAKELLEKGQTDPVLNYLKQLEKFWRHEGKPAPDLAAWEKEIKAGKVPDFKANLRY